jgi:DNA repair exonuclease SbcCD ATPase subunit
MKNLKFNYVRAKNILCFGESGIELDFRNYGNIVQIKGENLDNPGTDEDPASNAAGKSSLQELISIGLFGKTVKSPTKLKGGHFINVSAEKGEIELCWDDYRILRTFNKTGSSVTSKLQVWESTEAIWGKKTEKTQGKSTDTQRWIEQKIGLTHQAFCNIAIFDDRDTYSFLEADGPSKREFVENLLGLDRYRGYHENAKEKLKEIKQKLSLQKTEYQQLQNQVETAKGRISTICKQELTWKQTKNQEIVNLTQKIKAKQEELVKIDISGRLEEWQQAQQQIQELNTKIEQTQQKSKKTRDLIKLATEKLETCENDKRKLATQIEEIHLAASSLRMELKKHSALVEDLQSLKEGSRCPTCHGIIDKNNFGSVLTHSLNSVQGCQSQIKQKETLIELEKQNLGKKGSSVTTIREKIADAQRSVQEADRNIATMQNTISKLSGISKPDSQAMEQVLESQITDLKKQLGEKEKEIDNSPYLEILEQAKDDLNTIELNKKNKGEEINVTESDIPYYDYWVEAFSDKGIRKYVVEKIIPALNSRVAYWLQYLIDGRIELTFNNQLEETISRNGSSAYYYSMSNGERRRINLAISQAFAYVMMLNSGSCPSLVFLDEITGGGIDKAGTTGVYNMIFELAKERQVFVTTHNENLFTLLQGCEIILLRKKNDVTQLVT